MDEEQLRILIAANETASGPLARVTSGTTLLKTELTQLQSVMQKFGTKANYGGFDRGMKAMETRMASMRVQSEALRQQYVSLNRTVSASGGVAQRAAQKHAEASNIIRGAARSVPTYGARMDPKGIVQTEQATEKLSKAQRRNTQVTQQQGRMWGFAAREVHGLRLGMIGSAVSAAFFSKLLADAAINTANLGEEIMNVKRSFNITFEGEFRSGTEQLNLMRKASQGLITDFELMRTAVFVAQFPFENLKTLLPEIIEASTNLALAQGKDIPQSIDDMVRALGRGSSKILDNLGIILKVEQAHKMYAAQLGKTVQQLTEKEKAESFAVIGTQLLIEKGREYEGMNKKVETSIVGLENAWHSFAVEFAKFSVDPLSDAVDFVRDLVSGTEDLVKTWSAVVHYMSIFERIEDSLDYAQHGAYGDKLQEQLKIQREQKRIDSLSGRFQADPSSTIYEKIKQDDAGIKEDSKRAGITSQSSFFGSASGFGLPTPDTEDPKIVEEREKDERRRSRILSSLSRLEQSQKLRGLQDPDTASKYLSQNEKPSYDPLQRAKESIGYDPSKNMEEELNKTAKQMEKGLSLLTERWDAASSTVDKANKVRERNAENEKNLDEKILGFRNDILELERSYNTDRRKDLLSKDLDAARSFVGAHAVRTRQGEFDKSPVEIATKRAEGRIAGAKTSEEKLSALEFLKSELKKEIEIRKEYLENLSSANKTIVKYETDKAKAIAKTQKDDLDFLSLQIKERQDIERQKAQEADKAFRSLAEGSTDLAMVFGDSAAVMVSAGTSMIEQVRLFDDFSKISGSSGALGQAGAAATVASMIPEITNAIARSLESPAEKMDRAANKMLQASSEFSQDFLSQDPDYQKLRKALIGPIIGEAEKLLQDKDGDRFSAIQKFLTESIRYGNTNLKIADALKELKDPLSKQQKLLEINPNPFKAFYGQQTGEDGKTTEIFGEDIQKQLLAVFGPNATFADLQKEAIRLSDAFKLLVDQSNDLSDADKQKIKDDKDAERARIRGIAAGNIRDAGGDFVERNKIVVQLRSDLDQIRSQETSALNAGRTPGQDKTPSGVGEFGGITALTDVTPELDPNEGREFIDKTIQILKDSVDKSIGFIKPIIIAVNTLIESSEEGSTSRMMLEKLRFELVTGLNTITPISFKLGNLIESDLDGTEILATLDTLEGGA